MKNKNLLLVAVAVVCGIIAAALTMQMNAGGKTESEKVMIPVALKDIPIGTKLKQEELAQWVRMKEMPVESAPQVYVPTMEELANKSVRRTMRVDDVFNPADVSAGGIIMSPPPGYNMMTVRSTLDESCAGFIGPGAKVDVLASVQMKKSQKWIVFPLFTDMLVLAVDSNAAPAPEAAAFANLSMVSFAVDAEDSVLLQAAVTRGAQLRLTLRHPDKPADYSKIKPTTEQIWDILTDRVEDEKKPTAPPPPPEKKKVKVYVANRDVPAKTKLTESYIQDNFGQADYPEDMVPANAVRDLEELNNQYLLKDIAENQFVPESYLANKLPEEPKPIEPTKPETVVEQPKKPAPADAVSPKEAEVIPPKKAAPVKHYVDVNVQSPSGQKTYRYEVMADGGYKKLGEVDPSRAPLNADGTLLERKTSKDADGQKPGPSSGESSSRSSETIDA